VWRPGGARRSGRRQAGERPLFERLLFTVMGPADRGDLSAPVRQSPARPPARCSQCSQPYEDHEIVRDPGLTFTRCPPARS